MGGFGEGLGGVWGGFWEGFGKVWEPFGRSRTFSALFLDFAGLCWSFLAFSCSSLPFLVLPSLFSPLLAFGGLCWVSTRVIIAGGERSERAKRASEALWCFLWACLAYPCFRWRTLAFSCVACSTMVCLLSLLSLALPCVTYFNSPKRFRSYCCMLPLLSYVFALPVPC